MADVDEKDKAKELAAAKKRIDKLRKNRNKGAKASDSSSKVESQSTTHEENSTANDGEKTEKQIERNAALAGEQESEVTKDDTKSNEDQAPTDSIVVNEKPSHNRQPSLSLQSKMRSASFRRNSLSQGPLSPSANGSQSPDIATASPDVDSVHSIYRKQASRLDELEKENKRLAQEAQDASKRMKKSEAELDELREAYGEMAELKSKAHKLDAQSGELGKLRQENTSLQRQVSQLQSQNSKRHVSSPSQSNASTSLASIQSQLDSKATTIESMEMELSNLRSQLEKSSHTEQVAALEEKLDRAGKTAESSQRELADVKKNLARANDKALREGTEKTSAETQIRNMQREIEGLMNTNEESNKRAETLEKKLLAITNVNKDADVRRQASERERERLENEAIKFHRRLASLENENLQMREERNKNKMRHVQGTDEDGLDELEEAERKRFESRIRDLESQIFELRRGVWRERRRSIQPSIDGEESVSSPGGKFDEVDLNGPSPYRRQSTSAARGSGFSTVLNSGINAFTGGSSSRTDELPELDDDDGAFDEAAFREAQREEAMKRIERVKEIKRSLKDWEGWRLDIVDLRKAGGAGLGEIFDV